MATTMRQLLTQVQVVLNAQSGSPYYASAASKVYAADLDVNLAGDFDLKVEVPAHTLNTFTVEEA